MESLGTVERAVDVLFHLHGQSEPVGVTAIGRALGLPKSNVHRLLASLARRGLVERDERGRYRPGMGLVSLGLGAIEREPAVLAARPVLEAEAAGLGETFFLVGARAGELLVLDKVEGTGFLRAAPRVGSSVPVHATAVGKLFLAFGDGRIQLPETSLEAYTEHTTVDPGLLLGEVGRVRRNGYAENREEWIAGLAVVAAPVLSRGRLEAAVAVAVPAARIESLGPSRVARTTVAAGRRIGRRLEGEGV
ncbi:MAG: IclR family transcriptional regulator [Myxococcota bacterium]|nr:IclR family transcriptional regulator [Myxococcota bacterium]